MDVGIVVLLNDLKLSVFQIKHNKHALLDYLKD